MGVFEDSVQAFEFREEVRVYMDRGEYSEEDNIQFWVLNGIGFLVSDNKMIMQPMSTEGLAVAVYREGTLDVLHARALAQSIRNDPHYVNKVHVASLESNFNIISPDMVQGILDAPDLTSAALAAQNEFDALMDAIDASGSQVLTPPGSSSTPNV